MISLRNTQRLVAIDLNLVRRQVEIVRASLGAEKQSVGIWFASDSTLKRLNGQYRGKSKTTDVLSFQADGIDEGTYWFLKTDFLRTRDKGLGYHFDLLQ